MSSIPTRRNILKCGIAAAVVLPTLADSLTSPWAWAQSPPGLKIIPATDSQFPTLLDQNYTGLFGDPEANALQPLMLMIRNATDQNVSAFTMTWRFHSSSGNSEYHDYYVVSAAQNRLVTGAVPVIAKGGLRLISPFFSWSPKGYASQPKPLDWSKILSHNTLTGYRSHEMINATVIGYRLDAVIYNNASIEGPDRGKLARLYTATRNGEHDEAVSVHHLILKNQPPPSIDQLLTKSITTAPSSPDSRVMNRYTDARRRQAAYLLYALRTQDTSEFNTLISRLVKLPRTVIKPLAT
jgi:hypothetical protein